MAFPIVPDPGRIDVRRPSVSLSHLYLSLSLSLSLLPLAPGKWQGFKSLYEHLETSELDCGLPTRGWGVGRWLPGLPLLGIYENLAVV